MQRGYDTIPPESAAALRPALPGLADEIIATIAREVPDYERAMEGAFGDVVRLGVEIALGRFVDEVAGAEAADPTGRVTYVDLGRGEFHAGRSLDALLAAYRVGARIAWRRFVEAGVAGGLAPEMLYRVGEAIFEYIDVLSAESAEGYAAEQTAEMGERRRRRRRLVALLASDPPAGEEDIAAVAEEAGWQLPARLAALAVEDTGDAFDSDALEAATERLARVLGQGAIAAVLDGVAVALVPDPDAPGRRRQVAAAVEGRVAALGPSVTWSRAAHSIRRSRAALGLAASGRVATETLLVAEDHLATLLLSADPLLGTELAARELAPLDGLTPATRERLVETLAAWLDRPGQVAAVAAALEVHPQTVRYRVRQLRELFGERLDDPDARFVLALALRAGRS